MGDHPSNVNVPAPSAKQIAAAAKFTTVRTTYQTV